MAKNISGIEKHKFKPGQTGNPNGRPRKLPSIDRLLIEVLGEDSDDDSVAKAILQALAKKAQAGDVRAAEILLDRWSGKPKQEIKTDSEVVVTVRHES